MFDEILIDEQIAIHLKTRSADEFLSQATQKIARWFKDDPSNWMQFGPWWPAVRRVIMQFNPKFSGVDWPEEDPDYLAHYTYGDTFKDWVAAFSYLDRHGNYSLPSDQPHSVELANGEHALYVPNLGLMDE